MDNTHKLFLARNELENTVNRLEQTFGFTEAEMLVVVEMVLSTSRHRAFVRDAFNELSQIKNTEQEEKADGNIDETR